jgi:hypothetical protein
VVTHWAVLKPPGNHGAYTLLSSYLLLLLLLLLLCR